MKSIYESTGGIYQMKGDYALPCIGTDEAEYEIGVCGQRHRWYLKEHHRVQYYNLLTSGKLLPYLAEVDCRAEEMFLSFVKAVAEQESATEAFKAEKPMEWVRKMNSIRSRAAEVVNAEIIYT